MKLKVGDVVKLISGEGPTMVVADLNPIHETNPELIYFVGSRLISVHIKEECLIPADKKERLLYCTTVERPLEGEITQDYHDRYVVTRVAEEKPGSWSAYGKRVGPSTGPGTFLGNRKAMDKDNELEVE